MFTRAHLVLKRPAGRLNGSLGSAGFRFALKICGIEQAGLLREPTILSRLTTEVKPRAVAESFKRAGAISTHRVAELNQTKDTVRYQHIAAYSGPYISPTKRFPHTAMVNHLRRREWRLNGTVHTQNSCSRSRSHFSNLVNRCGGSGLTCQIRCGPFGKKNRIFQLSSNSRLYPARYDWLCLCSRANGSFHQRHRWLKHICRAAASRGQPGNRCFGSASAPLHTGRPARKKREFHNTVKKKNQCKPQCPMRDAFLV